MEPEAATDRISALFSYFTSSQQLHQMSVLSKKDLQDAIFWISPRPGDFIHIIPYLDSPQQLNKMLVMFSETTRGYYCIFQQLDLYDKYHKSFEDYIKTMVLPSIREKNDDKLMLMEFVRSWYICKGMVQWCLRIFCSLPSDFIARRSLPQVFEFGHACFRDLVYQEVNGKVRDAVTSLIDQEREGEQIDRALVKSVLDIFVEIGMGQMEYYENDFEASMLKDTASYYSRKASNWILEDSCTDYMLKAEECLKREKDRVNHYLHSSSEPKLLERVQHELLSNYASRLFRGDKVDDLSEMYSLFSKIPKRLDLVSSMFKEHVTAEGTTLVKQAEEEASDKKAEKIDVVGLPEQVFKDFVRKVCELHDKYLGYVKRSFKNDILFHKALKEAFEIFCNKCLAGSSSAKLFATFCDDGLKNGGIEKPSDEDIDTLKKVVKLLACISDKDVFAEFYWMDSEHQIPISERTILCMISYLEDSSGSCSDPQDDTFRSVFLYDKWSLAFKKYLNTKASPYLREKHGELMLMELVNGWFDHKVIIKWLSQAQQSLPSLNEVGLDCLRHWFYNEVNGKVRDAVISLIINLIDQDRDGKVIDRALLKNVIDIFVEIGMGPMEFYVKDFEASMLKDTSLYYSLKAECWIEEDCWPDYMLKVKDSLKREKDRVNHYLHTSSEHKLLEKVQHELLTVNASKLLEKEYPGCHAVVTDDKVDDLPMMYRLFSKTPKGLDHVYSMFKQVVTNEGTALLEQAKEDAASNKKVFVREVIELHHKYLAFLNCSFKNDTIFHKAHFEAFEVFCNKGVAGSSSAELLATFCDNILKKGGSEKLSDEATEDMLEKVVKLLACISDKDLFAEFYRRKLARRLLFDKSANVVHERSILTKLKQQFGGLFTSKMEVMVNDLILTKENQSHFEEYLSNNPNVRPGIDLTVTVLTTGFWPSYKSFDLNLPAEMVKCVEVFREFYQTKTKHRKLTWIYSLGTCNINGKFDAKTIELIVTTYQASALLLFNSSDRLSYQEIMTQLNLSDDDVVRLLHSLSCSKYKILLKEPNTKTISPTDTFEFNSKFTDKMRRIEIPLPPEDVDKDRRYAIDASIVRIMKSRKVLGYQQLVMECVEQLGRMFKPDVKAIKKRIEDLITRDYLERDEENPNLFWYLA